MNTINEEIAAIMELNEKRTQGEWRLSYRDFPVELGSGVMKITVEPCGFGRSTSVADQVENPSRLHGHTANDANFIAQAPAMVSIIKKLQAQLAERDVIMKNLATGIEIVLFTPDLPLMRCEIEGLKKSLTAYKAAITKPTEENDRK